MSTDQLLDAHNKRMDTDPGYVAIWRKATALPNMQLITAMLRWPELARAQGFLPNYRFTGKVQEITKQIGNAVPRRLARAIVAAAIRQDSDVRFLETTDAAKAA